MVPGQLLPSRLSFGNSKREADLSPGYDAMSPGPKIDSRPAARVRELRAALGWSQVEAAAYVGRSSNHFAGYEQARVEVPLFVLRLLQAALDARKKPNGPEVS